MNGTRTLSLLSQQSAAQALRALHGPPLASTALRRCHRPFTTSPPSFIKEFFPAPDSPTIRVTPAAWRHPLYTDEQMHSVNVAHRNAKTWSDKVALGMVRVLRWGLDRATGYVHKDAEELAKMDSEAARKKYRMTEAKYLARNVFLESVAGELSLPASWHCVASRLTDPAQASPEWSAACCVTSTQCVG